MNCLLERIFTIFATTLSYEEKHCAALLKDLHNQELSRLNFSLDNALNAIFLTTYKTADRIHLAFLKIEYKRSARSNPQ